VFNQQTQQLREEDARENIASVGFRHLDVGLADDNDVDDDDDDKQSCIRHK
jgi:hypothetical protein